MITRRRWIAASGAVLLAPSIILADAFAPKPSKTSRVGFLASRKRPEPLESDPYGAVPFGLRDLGYVEGRDFVMEWRFAAGDYAHLPELAAELVKIPVDVIVTDGTPGAKAAKGATKTIPIVFVGGSDVVKDGIVQSLAHPGGNTTGFSLLLPDTAPKQVELLVGAVPGLSRLAVLFNSGNPTGSVLAKSVAAAAERKNVQATPLGAQTAQEIETAIAQAAASRSQALLWIVDSYLFQQRRQIADLALQNRLPSISGYPEYAEAGGFIGYGPDRRALYRRVAGYVDLILKGANPGDLPVQQPSKLDLVINRRIAKTLGLTLAPDALVQADRVIE